METSVTASGAGEVKINEGPITQPNPTGFLLLGQQVNISAPPGTAQDPLIIIFLVDASVVPAGQSVSSIQVFKNGVLVENCGDDDPAGKAEPNPCVSKRNLLAGGDAAGDVAVTVLSSTASAWNFGVLVDTPTPTHTPISQVLPTVVGPTPGTLLGDVNCDEDINSIDAFFVLRFDAALYGFLPCPQNGDVNLGGEINSLDALFILQFHARLIPGLPPPGIAGGGWAARVHSWFPLT